MRAVAFLSLVFLACSADASSVAASTPAPPPGDAPSSDVPATTDPGTAPTCPKAGAMRVPGKVSAADVSETSGIVASTRNAGVYWVHNDSGDSARSFALGSDGELLATLTFDTKKPIDIEDMTIEDAPGGGSFLYFGDIGDNDEARASITILRVAEPTLDGAEDSFDATPEKMTVTYADGPHNAETLLFDPSTRDLLIATKKEGGPSAIHRVGAFVAGSKVTTEKIASVAIDLATGGQISRDGRLVAVRSYESAFVWTRMQGESLAAALARTPCTYPITGEKQGEAFAFLAGNAGFVTLSEGKSPDLHLTPFE